MIDIAELLVRNKTKLIAKMYAPWITKGSSVLDVGCGDGIVSFGLSNYLSVRITGCDIKQYLLRPIPYIHMVKHDELPFKASSFDSVMFNDVLHHTTWKNQKNLLRDAIRVAAKEILIFECTPTPFSYIADFVMNKLSQPLVDVPLTLRTKNQWLNIFNLLSVQVETLNVPQPFFSPFPHVVFRLKVLS